jgi:DhnA family fructose-bisphosphate aldolase class Ia
MHLSGSTTLGNTPNNKVLVSTPIHALELGADAVSVHVNFGTPEELEMLKALGKVADECDRLGLPLLGMMYARGEKATEPLQPEMCAHIARVGYEMGLDIVKVPYTGNATTFRQVVRTCYTPVVIAGGPKKGPQDGFLSWAAEALEAGAAGISFGRNVFMQDDILSVVKQLASIVFGQSRQAR